MQHFMLKIERASILLTYIQIKSWREKHRHICFRECHSQEQQFDLGKEAKWKRVTITNYLKYLGTVWMPFTVMNTRVFIRVCIVCFKCRDFVKAERMKK